MAVLYGGFRGPISKNVCWSTVFMAFPGGLAWPTVWGTLLLSLPAIVYFHRVGWLLCGLLSCSFCPSRPFWGSPSAWKPFLDARAWVFPFICSVCFVPTFSSAAGVLELHRASWASLSTKSPFAPLYPYYSRFFRRVFSFPLVAEMGRNAFMGIRVGQKWHIQKFGDRSIGRWLGPLSLPACLLFSPGLVSGRAGPMGGPAARRGGLP